MEGMVYVNMILCENFIYINYEFNWVFVVDYLFVIVLIVVLLISGVLGNFLVIKVYYFNIRVDLLSGRVFFFVLVVMDLLVCVVGFIIYMV